jgi:hypothetical protein
MNAVLVDGLELFLDSIGFAAAQMSSCLFGIPALRERPNPGRRLFGPKAVIHGLGKRIWAAAGENVLIKPGLLCYND